MHCLDVVRKVDHLERVEREVGVEVSAAEKLRWPLQTAEEHADGLQVVDASDLRERRVDVVVRVELHHRGVLLRMRELRLRKGREVAGDAARRRVSSASREPRAQLVKKRAGQLRSQLSTCASSNPFK